MIAWIGAGLMALVFAGVLWYARKAGKDSVTAGIGADLAATGERIAESQGKRVDTLSGLRDELRDRTGQL